MNIFLSHSKKDIDIVNRIYKDLRERGHTTFLDEEDIPIGGNIAAYIEEALSNSDILIIFLSTKSVFSHWVEAEWQTIFFDRVRSQKIFVVPVLLEKCKIPMLLKGIKHVDFTKMENYEENLSNLLRGLSKIEAEMHLGQPQKESQIDTIYDYTMDVLEDLDGECINIPSLDPIPIIDVLKNSYRSGKKLRLETYKIVKIRTIYDHICSIAKVADFLLPSYDHGLKDYEYADLARCIAFHELNEVILGDIPTYTTLFPNDRELSNNPSEGRLRTISPTERKRIANEFIWMFLDEKNKKSLEDVNDSLKDDYSKLRIVFKTLDKIDPIIATWRYLHVYRGKLGYTPKDFNKRMKDFYENPDIRNFLSANKVDNKIIDLILNLQDRNKAAHYYKNPDKFFSDDNIFMIPNEVIRNMIERVPLFISEPKKIEFKKK